MCELLGISFKEKVFLDVSFKAFMTHGKRNPDGWGIGFYDEDAIVLKEPVNSNESRLNSFLLKNKMLYSKIFIAHIRMASKGSVSYKNTHPFLRHFGGKPFIFAHNGTVEELSFFPFDDCFSPIGDTDSERIFAIILTHLKRKGIREFNELAFTSLHELLKEINEGGNLNLLFSDGKYLFAYFDKNGYNGLFYTQRKAPFSEIYLEDLDIKVNLRATKKPDDKGFIISTNPLTDEIWIPFEPEEMIVFSDGEIVYDSKKSKI